MVVKTDIIYGFGIYLNQPISDEVWAAFITNHREAFETKNEVNLPEIEGFFDWWRDFGKYLNEYFREYSCECSGNTGIGAVLSNIMSRETGIRLGFYTGEGNEFPSIMFVEDYPWRLNKIERELTEQVLSDIMIPYFKELGLTDTPNYIRMEYVD